MSRQGPQQDLGRIVTLDGFRALAILGVIAFHYTARWVPPRDVPPHLPVSSALARFLPFQYGWAGVQLFFVISGFVILMTLKRCRTPAEFARRRFARLWPALIVAASLTTVVVNSFGPPDWKVGVADYLTSLTLIKPAAFAVVGVHAHWVDGVYWTLWVELQFYVVVAAVYFLSGRHFLKTWLACQAALAICFPFLPAELINILTLARQMAFFTVGICVFELWSRTGQPRLALAGALGASALVLYRAFEVAIGWHVYAIVLCAYLAIFALMWLFLIDHPILKPLQTKPMIVLGQASYSLYLIHQEIGIVLLRQLGGIPFSLAVVLVSALCIAMSLALFRYVERPAKKWLLREMGVTPAATRSSALASTAPSAAAVPGTGDAPQAL